MSVCTFIAADHPLPEASPEVEYPLHIDLDNGVVEDGNADDNFRLFAFDDVQDYTDRKYGVFLEWFYTEGRAKQIISYIQTTLQHTDCVELWHVWMPKYYDERPVIRTVTLPISDLTAEDIRELDEAETWDPSGKEQPTYYCLKIVHG